MCGTGIKDVVARSGAPIGSLYHYFPGGKSQLVSEAVALHAAKIPRLIAECFDGQRSAAAAARMLFTRAADGFERTGADKGCAIGAVALDLTPADSAAQAACRDAFERWAAVLAARLPLPDARARRSLATTITVAIEGAFVLARAQRSGQPFRDAGRWMSTLLESIDSGAARPRKKP